MMADHLIDTGDIAADLGLVVKRPDFPGPLLVLSRKTVKWSSAQYETWKVNHYFRVSAQSR